MFATNLITELSLYLHLLSLTLFLLIICEYTSPFIYKPNILFFSGQIKLLDELKPFTLRSNIKLCIIYYFLSKVSQTKCIIVKVYVTGVFYIA